MDNMIVGDDNVDLVNDEDGEEDGAKLSGRPLLWQMEVLNDVRNDNSVELENTDTLNDNNTISKPCRNSVQVCIFNCKWVCTHWVWWVIVLNLF